MLKMGVKSTDLHDHSV